MRISDWSSDVCSSDLFGACPDMIEPPSAIRCLPVARAVAPPCEQLVGRWNEAAADVHPAVALLEAAQRRDLDRRVADDIEERLVAPDVAFERRDVEIAEQDRRLAQFLGPPRHPFEEA